MEIIQKWVPGKFIGRGSYGSVSIGIRESDGVRFAVKSAVKNCVPSMGALENEIEILRFLSSSSPFIVEYYGDDETTSHKNLHLEYLPEGDVAKIGGIGDDVEIIRSYTWCLVMALKEVHSKGIVHCDVKGSNVLVGSTKGVVKLSDFGSAKRIDDFDQRAKILPRGSPLWMAPEVVRGESQGCESDIWSLGCTVIEIFTGVPAWQDCGAHTLFQIGYSEDLPEYPTQLPEAAKDFLDKCLNRNPGQRWSCDQLLQHPFLLPVPSSKIPESSPRSILDWQNLDFSDEEEDDQQESPSTSSYDYQISEISARDRIGKLVTTAGVNWESDGWIEVRKLKQEVSVSEGASWEYSDFEENMGRANWEIHDNDFPTWISLSSDNDNDEKCSISGADGGDRCGHGGDMIEKIDETAAVSVDFSLVLLFTLLLVYYSSSFSRHNKILSKYGHYFIGVLLLSNIEFYSLRSCQLGIILELQRTVILPILIWYTTLKVGLNEFTNQKSIPSQSLSHWCAVLRLDN